jgi:hypothetical protein
MRIKGKEYKAILIMGAGATKGALCGTRSPRITPPLNSDYFEILAKFVRTTEGKRYISSYERLMTFLDREIGQKGVQEMTMEQVFNVLFISKDLPEIFHRGQGRRREPGYRQEIMDFLSLLVRLFHFVQSKSNKKDNLSHHEIIANSLSPGDVIMTLNYDTILDNALCSVGWDPRTGYGFQANVRYTFAHPPINPKFKNVVLLKPHGSFNWFAKGKSDDIENVLERRPVSRIVVSHLPMLNERRNQRLVRFFIPPLYTKFFNNKFWRKLWRLTYEAAREKDRIIVIGCSLIATDYHLRAILSKAMYDRGKKYREIILVDPSSKVQASLKSFFRGRSNTGCKVYPTFSSFCRDAVKN